MGRSPPRGMAKEHCGSQDWDADAARRRRIKEWRNANELPSRALRSVPSALTDVDWTSESSDYAEQPSPSLVPPPHFRWSFDGPYEEQKPLSERAPLPMPMNECGPVPQPNSQKVPVLKVGYLPDEIAVQRIAVEDEHRVTPSTFFHPGSLRVDTARLIVSDESMVVPPLNVRRERVVGEMSAKVPPSLRMRHAQDEDYVCGQAQIQQPIHCLPERQQGVSNSRAGMFESALPSLSTDLMQVFHKALVFANLTCDPEQSREPEVLTPAFEQTPVRVDL